MKAKYITMIVNDLDESVKFYRDAMGFPVDSTYELGENGRIAIMDGGQALLELIESPAFPAGLYSVGVDVESLDETLDSLRARGVKLLSGVIPTTIGVMAFAQDPTGVRLALIEHRK